MKVNIAAYDKDIFSADEKIGNIILDLRRIFKEAKTSGDSKTLNKEFFQTRIKEPLYQQADEEGWDEERRIKELGWLKMIEFDSSDDMKFWVQLTGKLEKTQKKERIEKKRKERRERILFALLWQSKMATSYQMTK